MREIAVALPPGTANFLHVHRPDRSHSHLFWRFQIGGWVLLMPILTGFAITVFHDFNTALLIGVVRQLIGFGLTLGLLTIYRRWPAANFNLRKHAWQIVMCCLAATAIDYVLAEIARHLMGIALPSPTVQYGALLLRVTLYVGWSALYFVIRQELESRETQLRLARAESANREAELLLLRAQMNPHFLFNALTTIIGEAEQNPAAVVETTHAVADYLRYSLSQNGHQAPLGDELNAMSNYLRVECSNYGAHRLEWVIDVTDDARLALAPTALVQPLIENAIKYGLRSSPSPLKIRVEARVAADRLLVTVENSGDWVARQAGEAAAPDSHGIGLTNLKRRLSLLFGETARFEVTTPPGRVRITTHLPYAIAPLATPRRNSALPFASKPAAETRNQ